MSSASTDLARRFGGEIGMRRETCSGRGSAPDHRLVSLGRMTVDEWVSSQQALGELVQTISSFVVNHLAVARDRLWSQVGQHAVSAEGSDVDYSFQSVIQVRDGKIVVWEVFPDTAADEARELYL